MPGETSLSGHLPHLPVTQKGKEAKTMTELVIQGIGEEIGRFFPGAYQEFQIPATVESIPVYGSQIFR